MSESVEPEPVGRTEDLQFEHAEVESPDAPADEARPPTTLQCASCSTALSDAYFAVGDAAFCRDCKDEVVAAVESRTQPIRLLRALLYGVPAAMVGSGIYYAIVAITDYEIGLVSILIGFMVGAAVRAAAGPGGGRRFQLIAAGLTYCAIVTTYVPFVIEAFQQSAAEQAAATQGAVSEDALPAAAEENDPLGASADPAGSVQATDEAPASMLDIVLAFAIIFGIAFVAPFLAGFENIIGIFIIGFGVYQAWRMNQRTVLEITGPHLVAPQPVESA